MKIRLIQSLTNKSINFGVDSAAIAMTIINVPKTVANTPPHISGAKVRSTAPVSYTHLTLPTKA